MKFVKVVSSLLVSSAIALSAGCVSPKAPGDSAAIYDVKADGRAQLHAALDQAARTHKRVLVDLGANWCSDSQATYRLLRNDPAIRHELESNYVLVLVDVNDKDGPPRNRELLHQLGNLVVKGIPVLLVLAPDGTLLNTDPNERLRDDAYQRPGEVLAYLKKWKVSP